NSWPSTTRRSRTASPRHSTSCQVSGKWSGSCSTSGRDKATGLRLRSVGENELADLGVNDFTPAPAAENAVMPAPGHFEMLAALRRDAFAQGMRGLGLAVAGNIVQFAFHGEQRGMADVLRPHQPVAHEKAPARKLEFLENALHRVEVVLRRHVQHG